MKHYDEIEGTVDKIVHILYAGYVCDYYQQCLADCEKNFGQSITQKAKYKFEKEYKQGATIIKT